MRSKWFSRWAARGWLVAVVLALGSGPAEAARESDISTAAATASLEQIKQHWGLEIPFLAQVLSQVPVRKAPPELLQAQGSLLGIYLHGRVFVSQSLFRPDGTLDVGSPASLGVLVHESWHAYYELLLPAAQKVALDREFRFYYSPRGTYPQEEWSCFGDEAIGNYYGDLVVSYTYAVKKLLQLGTVPEGSLGVYRRSFEAKELHGYGTDDAVAPLPISAAERAAALRLAGGAFPPPDKLIEALKARFPAPRQPEPPAPSAAAPEGQTPDSPPRP